MRLRNNHAGDAYPVAPSVVSCCQVHLRAPVAIGPPTARYLLRGNAAPVPSVNVPGILRS